MILILIISANFKVPLQLKYFGYGLKDFT